MRRALVATFEQDLRIQLPGASCAANRLNPFKIASHLSLGGSERKPLSFHLVKRRRLAPESPAGRYGVPSGRSGQPPGLQPPK
jgi:hypothetical protein